MKKQKFLIRTEFSFYVNYVGVEAETLEDAWQIVKDNTSPADMRELKQAQGVAIDDMTEITP